MGETRIRHRSGRSADHSDSRRARRRGPAAMLLAALMSALLFGGSFAVPAGAQNDSGCVSDALMSRVRRYYDVNKDRGPGYGANWKRVLVAFGDVEDSGLTAMTAADAAVRETRWWGWKPVREALECIEAEAEAEVEVDVEAEVETAPLTPTTTTAPTTTTVPVAVPEISVAAGSDVSEGVDAAFTVSASPAPASPVTVNVEISQSGDFAATGSRTVTVGTSGTATLAVPTVDDTVDEPDGSITATVNTGAGYTVSASAGSATVGVTDDDVPEISVAQQPETQQPKPQQAEPQQAEPQQASPLTSYTAWVTQTPDQDYKTSFRYDVPEGQQTTFDVTVHVQLTPANASVDGVVVQLHAPAFNKLIDNDATIGAGTTNTHIPASSTAWTHRGSGHYTRTVPVTFNSVDDGVVTSNHEFGSIEMQTQASYRGQNRRGAGSKVTFYHEEKDRTHPKIGNITNTSNTAGTYLVVTDRQADAKLRVVVTPSGSASVTPRGELWTDIPKDTPPGTEITEQHNGGSLYFSCTSTEKGSLTLTPHWNAPAHIDEDYSHTVQVCPIPTSYTAWVTQTPDQDYAASFTHEVAEGKTKTYDVTAHVQLTPANAAVAGVPIRLHAPAIMGLRQNAVAIGAGTTDTDLPKSIAAWTHQGNGHYSRPVPVTFNTVDDDVVEGNHHLGSYEIHTIPFVRPFGTQTKRGTHGSKVAFYHQEDDLTYPRIGNITYTSPTAGSYAVVTGRQADAKLRVVVTPSGAASVQPRGVLWSDIPPNTPWGTEITTQHNGGSLYFSCTSAEPGWLTLDKHWNAPDHIDPNYSHTVKVCPGKHPPGTKKSDYLTHKFDAGLNCKEVDRLNSSGAAGIFGWVDVLNSGPSGVCHRDLEYLWELLGNQSFQVACTVMSGEGQPHGGIMSVTVNGEKLLADDHPLLRQYKSGCYH